MLELWFSEERMNKRLIVRLFHDLPFLQILMKKKEYLTMSKRLGWKGKSESCEYYRFCILYLLLLQRMCSHTLGFHLCCMTQNATFTISVIGILQAKEYWNVHICRTLRLKNPQIELLRILSFLIILSAQTRIQYILRRSVEIKRSHISISIKARVFCVSIWEYFYTGAMKRIRYYTI